MSDDKAKEQIDRPERTVEARALKAPDVHSARLSGHDKMRRVEQARTNASDGSLRKLPADWQEQNESIQLTDGEVSISRTNPLREADLASGKGRNANGKPYSVYSAEASQAVERPGPVARALTDGDYQSSVKLNVQITNVPEVSKGVGPEDLLTYAGTIMDAGAKAVRPIEEHLSKPNALNEDLWNLPGAAMGGLEHLAKSPEQVNKDVAALTGRALDVLDRPMEAKQRATLIGALMPMFFLEGHGQPIESEAARQMKLEQMSAEQLKGLGIERVEMRMPEVPPQLRHLKLTKAEPELLDAMRAKGREFEIIEPGTLARGRLDGLGKEAAVLISFDMPDLIQLKVGASKIAALEEFLHGTQFRNPSLAELPIAIREIHVKDFMIRHSKMLGLSENDLSILRALMQDEIQTAYRQGWVWKR
jgi:hypothetical protein